MPFISREDQVPPCHMSPGRHSVNMLLKTLYDEDLTTFPSNLLLTQIFLTLIRPIAFFPIHRGHEDKIIPFSVAVFYYHASSQSTLLQTI